MGNNKPRSLQIRGGANKGHVCTHVYPIIFAKGKKIEFNRHSTHVYMLVSYN